MLIIESTVSPFVRRLCRRHTSVVYGPRSTFEALRTGCWAAIAWRQGELIYSVSADLPLTTAQLMAVADSTTSG